MSSKKKSGQTVKQQKESQSEATQGGARATARDDSAPIEGEEGRISGSHTRVQGLDGATYTIRGGLLDAQEIPFTTAPSRFTSFGDAIVEKPIGDVSTFIDEQMGEALARLFPSSSQHQGIMDNLCRLFLPELTEATQLAALNEQAASMFEALSVYIRAKADHNIVAKLRVDDPTLELADVATRIIPTHPTLLPLNYAENPAQAMRDYAQAVKALFDKPRSSDPADQKLAPMLSKLVWFPGVSLAGYNTHLNSLRLRKFTFGIGDVLTPGDGIVTCQAWMSAATGTPETRTGKLVTTTSLAMMAAQMARRTDELQRHLSVFINSNVQADCVPAWANLIGAMMAEMGLATAYRARVQDFALYPTVTAADLPKYSPETRPAATLPYMPDRARRGGSKPRRRDVVVGDTNTRVDNIREEYQDDEGAGDF